MAPQSGRFEALMVITENSGPLFSCSRTYSPRILKAMSRPFTNRVESLLKISCHNFAYT